MHLGCCLLRRLFFWLVLVSVCACVSQLWAGTYSETFQCLETQSVTQSDLKSKKIIFLYWNTKNFSVKLLQKKSDLLNL